MKLLRGFHARAQFADGHSIDAVHPGCWSPGKRGSQLIGLCRAAHLAVYLFLFYFRCMRQWG